MLRVDLRTRRWPVARGSEEKIEAVLPWSFVVGGSVTLFCSARTEGMPTTNPARGYRVEGFLSSHVLAFTGSGRATCAIWGEIVGGSV